MDIKIPTNDEIFARIKGKPAKPAATPVPSLKLSQNAPVKPASSSTVKTPTPFAATPAGIALNTLNPVNIAKAGVDLYKPLIGDVGGVLKDIAKGTLSFGASAVEAVPRLASGVGELIGGPEGGKVSRAEYTYNVPGLGPVESIQTKAIRNLKAGDSTGVAVGKAAIDAALNEPTGVALKPAFVVGSLFFKSLAKQGLEPLAAEALKHKTAEDFTKAIQDIGAARAEGKPLLPSQQEILDTVAKYQKNGGKDFNLAEFHTKVQEAAAKEAAATAEKTATPTRSQIEEPLPAQTEAPTLKETPQVRLPVSEELAQGARASDTLLDDITKVSKSADELNLDHLNISTAGKKLIDREFADLASKIGPKVGAPLTHSEILKTAKDSAKILTRAVGREQTAEYERALLNLRQTIAAQAQSGTVTREFIDNLQVLKTQGTDIARKLNSLAIAADPREMTGKRAILDAVLRTTDNIDEILKAAEGVDFNDAKQATEFFRKFVAPKAGEWLDLLRYNSMLSSPKTHLINIFSNAVNATIAPALTKAIRGGFDFLGSAAAGRNRKYYAGESGAYLKGLVKSYKEAVGRFADVWKGNRDFTNLDYRNVPLATKGAPAIIEKFLSVPTKALEGADQFFMQLVQGGEKAALAYRAGKGVSVKNVEQQAEDAAKYILYRGELKKEGQGHLLNAMDTLTGVVTRLRNDPNPVISYPAKFTFPFISTPTNILKQGIEFSPLGLATIPGAKNKMEQAIKAAVGTGIAIAGGTLIASNRMTWGEPTTQAEKNAFREAGMQPYSIKLGDRWYSYQKLPPFLAFPLSMVAVVNDALQNKKIDDSTADVVLSSVAKYATFFSDQSYFKSMGDLWSAINGDEYAISRLIGNYPQQLVPYRALTGWLARLTDPLQRTIAPDSGFIDKQVQLLMQQYPGLSQMTTPRIGPSGEAIRQPEPLLNAFSPIQTQPQTEAQAKDFGNALELKQIVKRQTAESATLKAQAEELVERAKKLPKDQAIALLEQETKGNDALATKVKSVIADQKKNFTYSEKLIDQLGVTNGERANYIVQHVQTLGSREEKIAYLDNLKAKGLISKNVQKQIAELLSKNKATVQ